MVRCLRRGYGRGCWGAAAPGLDAVLTTFGAPERRHLLHFPPPPRARPRSQDTPQLAHTPSEEAAGDSGSCSPRNPEGWKAGLPVSPEDEAYFFLRSDERKGEASSGAPSCSSWGSLCPHTQAAQPAQRLREEQAGEGRSPGVAPGPLRGPKEEPIELVWTQRRQKRPGPSRRRRESPEQGSPFQLALSSLLGGGLLGVDKGLRRGSL